MDRLTLRLISLFITGFAQTILLIRAFTISPVLAGAGPLCSVVVLLSILGVIAAYGQQ